MTTTAKKSRSLFISLLAIAILIGITTVIAQRVRGNASDNYAIPADLGIGGIVLDKPRALQDFHLTNNLGGDFTLQSLKGHWNFVFFGFTHCGYVCPTTMAALTQMYTQIRTKMPVHAVPQVWFVSVDPEHDSVERVNNYVKSYSPEFNGARGDTSAVQQLAQQFGVVIQAATASPAKEETVAVSASMPATTSTTSAAVASEEQLATTTASASDEGSAINHSAEIVLVDPEGNIRAFFSFPQKGEQLAQDYEHIMGAIPPQPVA